MQHTDQHHLQLDNKMGKTLYYNAGLSTAVKDLAKALKVKAEGNILNDSEIKNLTTLGTAYWDDDNATGITSCYNGTTWTVRWDYDPVKLTHINMQYGSQKAAYIELSEYDYKARQRHPEASRPYEWAFKLFCSTL